MKSKILVVSALFIILSTSCSKSNEEKAQDMAANYLKGELFHFDSYVPLQTKVDSSFVSLSSDIEAIELTLEIFQLFQSVDEYVEKIKTAERKMDIWSYDMYSTQYSRGEYNRAKEDRDTNQKFLDKIKERLQAKFDKIKIRQSEIRTGNFEGWKVYHKFKSSNGARTMDLSGEYIFFCDENFNEKFVYPKEGYDAIKKIMEIIERVDDLSQFIKGLQELAF